MVKVGDRVSIDSLKVGQARRTGTVEKITQGLSGTRYLVRWDDGHESFFSPSGGNLIVEPPRAGRKAGGNSKRAPSRAATKASSPAAAKRARKGKR